MLSKCNKRKFDKIKAMMIVANAQKKHKIILIEEKLEFISVWNVMRIILQVKN